MDSDLNGIPVALLAAGIALLSVIVPAAERNWEAADLGAEVALSPGSVALTLLVGIVAVTAAPLLITRRLRRMDIPSTLRVME